MQQACDAALAVLARSRADIPFASICLLDAENTENTENTEDVAWRAAFFGMIDDPRIVPAELDPDRDDQPLWAVLNSAPAQRSRVLTGLAADYPGWFTPTGGPMGDAAPDAAVAIPLVTAGGGDPAGVFFAGVSPYRALDADYHRFLDLVARQVSTAIADAQTYQAQRRRPEELAELDRAKTEFFTGVRHELRTPLTLITGPAEDSLADTQDPPSPGQRTRVELIRRNSARLCRLVDTLLDFARLEGGQLTPDRVAVDLAALTRGIAESFAPAVTRAGLRFMIDRPDLDAKAVAVDAGLDRRVGARQRRGAVRDRSGSVSGRELCNGTSSPLTRRLCCWCGQPEPASACRRIRLARGRCAWSAWWILRAVSFPTVICVGLTGTGQSSVRVRWSSWPTGSRPASGSSTSVASAPRRCASS
ncbi:MAG TPA: histidine kinase dimerization/phospho-acceptor domain-containing protein [Pseudonocardiaceae bacterium]|nr:histidine kinase dimerization/phospho-acceptor domain-containing protein [Pseudonocardiaceae bacterium]